MEILLLGTGSADGWPNPWCTCASCEWARTSGIIRSHTAALIDQRLLIDCGPDVPRQADRAGVGLAHVSTILLTHAHPDHVGPAAFLWRSWAGRAEPLRVFGPPQALELCRDWIGPTDQITLEPLSPGDSVVVDGFAISVLAASHATPAKTDSATDDALLYDVTGSDGTRLFYGTDSGPLSPQTLTALHEAAFDVVLLDETFGDRSDHGTGHHDLASFAAELVRLRSVGAIVSHTDVIAVHLGHNNPPPPELEARLARWGARVVPDLTILNTNTSIAAQPAPRRTLVTGGARSGKSVHAEELLAAHGEVHYVATSGTRDDDPEWIARVHEHQGRRPAAWTTVETWDVSTVLSTAPASSAILVDCLALWLTAVMDDAAIWELNVGDVAQTQAVATINAHIDALVLAVRRTQAQVVIVTNEVGSGVVPDLAGVRLYRDLLGTVNARIAAQCEAVHLVVAGRAMDLHWLATSGSPLL